MKEHLQEMLYGLVVTGFWFVVIGAVVYGALRLLPIAIAWATR